MSEEQALRVVEELQEALQLEDVVASLDDQEVDRRVRATFGRLAEPDFEVRMSGPERLGGSDFVDRGADGFNRLWRDWTEGFESFRIEVERTLAAVDEVVTLVRIQARTQTGGVELAQPAAALWRVREGRLVGVEFHLDPDLALRRAGLKPGNAE